MAWSGPFVMFSADKGINGGWAGVYTNSNCGTVDFASISDGSSNSAMLSETHLGSGPPASQVTLSTPSMAGAIRTCGGPRATRPGTMIRAVLACRSLWLCPELPGDPRQSGGLWNRHGAPAAQRRHLALRQPRVVHDVGCVQPLHAPQQHRLRLHHRRQHAGLCRIARCLPAGQQPSGRHQH